ncbi:MAG: class I SAM-dependent methyltransferase [Methylotenera sp.]|nr:class I SAM-dependent methyltransferase [Methylotenera sp.]MDD4924906.1 class I SAM-dependent methyltransferase [Methylotenera sp.]
MAVESIQTKIKKLESKDWTKGDFSKQNWGVWMHSISSYVGRIKPAFAHCLIDIFSEEGHIVFDPFCGVGTIPLEADNMGRKSIANDLNPYAHIITNAKFDRRGIESEIQYLSSLNGISGNPDLTSVPEWVRVFYHDDTLREILIVRDKLVQDERYFLLGCLLGIVHGHRKQHLSMRTGYIIPYIPNPKPEAEYREVIPRLVAKAKRMYSDPIPEQTNGNVIFGDARKLELPDNSVDVIISSPPYYHTLDYVHSNRLRLWFAGVAFDEQDKLADTLIQQRHTYLVAMKEVGLELKRVMKNDSLCVFILGDVHLSAKNTLNTAEDISKLYEEIGFKTHAIIDDEIPASRTTIVKYGGDAAIQNKKTKLDRILVMSKK